MKSHFRIDYPKPQQAAPTTISRAVAMACAVSGASAMLTGVCSAQSAADYATNPTYAGGWAAGQNGGYGFGAWSFNGTSTPGGVADPGGQQTMSSSSALGTAWTMFNLGTAPPSGLSDVGRSINGGLQANQIFQTVIQNPVGYHFYGGFDIMFFNGTDNNAGGNNNASIRVSEFNYYTTYPYWTINDAVATNGFTTPLSSATTAVSGMKLSLDVYSATSYSVTLTPLSNPSAAYTYIGTYSGGPIDYVNFRLYDGLSSGPNDTANNFEISSMTVVPEPSSLALLGLGAAGLWSLRRRKV